MCERESAVLVCVFSVCCGVSGVCVCVCECVVWCVKVSSVSGVSVSARICENYMLKECMKSVCMKKCVCESSSEKCVLKILL